MYFVIKHFKAQPMNLPTLVNSLSRAYKINGSLADPIYLRLLKKYDSKDYLKYQRFEKPYGINPIVKTDMYELFLVTMSGYGNTDIHEHNFGGGWLKVLDGNVKESLYNKKFKLIEEDELLKNKVKYLNHVGYYHLLYNKCNLSHLLYLCPTNTSHFYRCWH